MIESDASNNPYMQIPAPILLFIFASVNNMAKSLCELAENAPSPQISRDAQMYSHQRDLMLQAIVAQQKAAS